MSIASNDVDALIYRGIAYYCLEEKYQAFADWMQAKALSPGNGQVTNLLTFGKAGVHLQECRGPKSFNQK